MAKRKKPEETPEPAAPEKRSRMILDMPPLVREAVRLRAMKLSLQRRRRVPDYEVVGDILAAALADEIRTLEAGN